MCARAVHIARPVSWGFVADGPRNSTRPFAPLRAATALLAAVEAKAFAPAQKSRRSSEIRDGQ